MLKPDPGGGATSTTRLPIAVSARSVSRIAADARSRLASPSTSCPSTRARVRQWCLASSGVRSCRKGLESTTTSIDVASRR